MKVLFAGALLALVCGVLVASAQNVRISEFMANNDRVLAAPDGEFTDWIEIENADSVTVNLGGWYLTDDPLALNKWQFPPVTLTPGAFLVVFASGKNLTSVTTNLHTSFQLNADGGFLALVKPDGTTVASAYAPYPAVKEDVAFGLATTETTSLLLPNAAPQILVPTNESELHLDWHQLSYLPGPNWSNGVAPPSVGFDTNQAVGAPVNVAISGTAVQSTTLSSFTANSAIDNNFGNFSHTATADSSAFWQLTLTNRMAIFSVVLFNRTSCCGSRLRDITIEILSTNESGTVTNYTSPLLNPENTGFSYPNGPGYLSNNLVAATGGPVSGNIVRVRRTADPDLSGTSGQGNTDEPNVLSLGEVVVNASAAAGLRPYFRNDVQGLAFERNASVFVRVPFTSSETPDSLTMTVRHDDGFVAYLNGTEILRRNAPATLAWNSAATVDRNFAGAIAQEQVDISTAIPLLQSGANVLALQMLNFSAANGDLLFDPVLTAVRRQTTTNVFLVDATPGSANRTEWYLDEVRDTQFSVDRGFFEAPFSLSITSATPGAAIYYSFNGDEPGPGKGLLYSGPITISNTTILRARAWKENWKPSDVDSQTYIFLADVIHQAENWASTSSPPPPYFPASWGRNRVDYGMDTNVVKNYSAAQWKEALTQIPTMSVITEMRYLFDPATGIYANADGHGELWERPASLELLDPANAVPGRFQENCGLRIRGGFSRNADFVKHSFRVFFRRAYGAGRLNYPLFDDDGAQEFETFDLRTSQNYAWPRETSVNNGNFDTMVREVFCRETLGAMGQPYRRSRYYHLYVNGQYWGLYETDERPEASYGETYFGGQKENFDVVKCGNRSTQPNFITEATDGNLIAWSNLWTMTRSMVTDASPSNYFRIIGCNPDGTRNPTLPVMIDVDNLIDYMLEIFWSGDGDATLSSFLSNNQPNNWFGMRDRTNPNVGFRFFNSDCEHTMGSPNSQVDRTGPFGGSNQGNFLYSNPQWMHEELMRSPEYRVRFGDHVQRHCFGTGALTPGACTTRFMRKAAQITKAIRAYSARWGDAAPHEPPYGEAEWTNAITFATNWIQPRTGILLAQLRADDLFPATGAPMFSQFGGEVPPGFQLELQHTNTSGAIFYTTDGSDPRAVGGNPSAAAQSYSAPITITAATTVRARVLTATNWSAIIEYVFFPPQDFSKLLITEIMYHPPNIGAVDSDEYEFVELKNAGTNTLSLGGLRFNGITYTFPANSTLAPGQFYVIVHNAARFAEKYPGVTINGTYSGRLDNGGETISISHPLGGRILSANYDDDAPWPIAPDEFGFSLVPVQPNANPDPDNAANWRASTFRGGSPGADDPAPIVAPVLISEVLSHSETGSDFIELFNPNAAAVDIGGWFLSDAQGAPTKYRIPDGTFIAALSYLVFDESDFNPTPGTNTSFSLNATGDDVFLFSGDANTNLTGYSHGFSFGAAPDGGTFGRYVISTGEDQFPAQIAATPGQPNAGPRIGPIVINEIHYHPDTDGDEFLELKNISTNTVDFFDPANPFNTWFLSGIAYEFPYDVHLGPGELMLLVATDPDVFRAKYSVPSQVQILGPYLGVLQGSGERLQLQRPDVPDTNGVAYITVDEVRYNDKSPWPIAADGSGPSLQRRNSAAYGNDPANWEAALATPGAEFLGGQSPAITTQPQNQTAFIGQTATFTVAASGPGPLTYRWRFNGSDIPAANGTTLMIGNVRAADAGSYSVVVFNAAGSAASAIAILTVRQPPVINSHPVNQFVRPGVNATFSVAATGNGFLRYQWQRDGTNLFGATNATLVVTNAQFANEGMYRAIVTDSIGPAFSNPAQLLILVDPEFIEHPVSLSVVTGTTFTISATVTNTATLPLGYRLRRNNINQAATHINLNARTVYFTILAERPFTNYAIVATNAAATTGRLSRSAIITLLDDSDSDGLPDIWETAYGSAASDRNGDADGDGASNWSEYIAGTDPTNALSYLKLELSAESNLATLKFGALSNKTYTVEFTENLDSSPWTKLTDVSTRTTNRVESIPDANWRPSRYYRLATPRKN